MLWDGADALDLVGALDVECLDAAVIKDVPELDHALRVCRDKTVKVGKAVDANKRVFVPIKLHDGSGQVWVPNEDFELEAAANEHFVLLAVSHLANGFLMPLEQLYRLNRYITVDILAMRYVFEMVGN